MQKNEQTTDLNTVFVEIRRELYDRVKFAALKKHLTIRQYLEELLDEMIPELNDVVQPRRPISQETVDRLRDLQEKLFRENNYQYMGNSVEELREAREERTRQLMGEYNEGE